MKYPGSVECCTPEDNSALGAKGASGGQFGVPEASSEDNLGRRSRHRRTIWALNARLGNNSGTGGSPGGNKYMLELFYEPHRHLG